MAEPALCWRDVDDAVAKIDAVLRDEARQRQLAQTLAARAGQFSTERFMSEFREVVEGFAARMNRGSVR